MFVADQKGVSNGDTSYRTRARTGSLRPRRYLSSDEDEGRVLRKSSKRAPSYSSRESSLHFADEEDNDSTEGSSSDSQTHSDNSDFTRTAGKRRRQKAKVVNRKRRKAASRSRPKSAKKRHRKEFTSGDEYNDSDDETEESDSSDSDSEVDHVHRPKAKSRAGVYVETRASGKKRLSSGTRTTRNQGKRTFNYLEDSDDEYEDPSRLSVSSRGRVRKMTKRARANRTDD